MLFDPESLSADLSWQQFEMLAEEAFKSHGYRTIRNFRMKAPRSEIDLLAQERQISFAVDCKHWRRTVGQATMTRVGQMQIERCKHLLRVSETGRVIPVILTWRDESLYVLKSGVPIVPINKISDFVLNWEASPRKIRVVQRRTPRKPHAKKSKIQKDGGRKTAATAMPFST